MLALRWSLLKESEILPFSLRMRHPSSCKRSLGVSAYSNNYFHHHHHIALVARISLTFSRHSSLSFIALGRSSGQHPVSSHSCWIYVRAGHPAFARPCVGVHKSTSLMSSSLLLQQCPATAGEEARRQLHKNATCNLEQVLAATPHKTPTVRPSAPYHENYSS